MILSILLAASAVTVAIAEFLYRGNNKNDETRLSWTKIIAACVVFFIGIYKVVEPSLMECSADKYYQNEEYAKAIALYKKLELTDPENTYLLSKIAQIYMNFAGQAHESVIKDEFYEKSIEYYARLSVYNEQAIEPKLAMISLFSIAGKSDKYTEYFSLIRAQVGMEGYLKNYDGTDASEKQLSEVHRKLADYLVHAYRNQSLKIHALRELGLTTSESRKLLDLALDHLEKANQLYPNSQGVLIIDSQISLMRSRLGDINSSENISYLQRAFNSSLNLIEIDSKIRHRSTMQTRLLLKILLDYRVSEIDTKDIVLSNVVDKLENETKSLPKDDDGYIAEFSNNASYLYQAYKNQGNDEKAKEWEPEVINLRSYLKPIRKKFLCENYNIVCKAGS